MKECFMDWWKAEKSKLLSWFKKEKTYIDHWFETDERIRFVLVGIVNMAIRYLLFVAITWFISVRHYQISLLLAWFLSSFWAFFTYKILVFQTCGNHLKEYIRSVMVWSTSYVLNAGILHLLVAWLSFNVYLSQAIAIVIIVVVNYLLFKHFAFKQSQPLKWWEKAVGFFDVFKK